MSEAKAFSFVAFSKLLKEALKKISCLSEASLNLLAERNNL
jgi:hypothetical protein